MRKNWERILAAILCVLMLLPTSAVPALAAGNQGSVGDGLHWSLDEAGCLTISGEGAIPDYASDRMSDAPWYHLREGITKIVIEEGVTEIGHYSLFDMWNVTSVQLPRTLERIGNQAMAYLRSLTSVQVPDSVEHLGAACFGNCNNLKTVYVYNPNAYFEYLPFGYRYDPTADDYLPIDDVTVYGYDNSTARDYADQHWNIAFVSLGGGAISGSVKKTEVMERTDARDFIHIKTVEDLKKIAEDPSGSYILDNDLDMSEEWEPVDLSGTFDGQGYTIRGLLISGSETGWCGLFGKMSGTVSNLTVEGRITAGGTEWASAGLLASMCTGTVVNCRAEGSVSVHGAGTGFAGLMTGQGGTYVSCHAEGTVQLTTAEGAEWAFAGGLSGTYVESALDCSFSGSIDLIQTASAPNLKAEVRGIASEGTDVCVNCTVSGSLSMDVLDCSNSGAIALEGAAMSENNASVTVTAEGDIYAHGCARSTQSVNYGAISATSTGDSGTSNAAGLMKGDGGQNHGVITAYSSGKEAVAQGISAVTGVGLVNTASVSAEAPNGQAASKGIETSSASDCENSGTVYATGFEAAATALSGCDYSRNIADVTALGVSTAPDTIAFAVGVSDCTGSENMGSIHTSGAILNRAFGCRSCTDSKNTGTVTSRSQGGDSYAFGLFDCIGCYNSASITASDTNSNKDTLVQAWGFEESYDCVSEAHVSATSDFYGYYTEVIDGETYHRIGHSYSEAGNSTSAHQSVSGYYNVTQTGNKTETYYIWYGRSGIVGVYTRFPTDEEDEKYGISSILDFSMTTTGGPEEAWQLPEIPELSPASRADIVSAGFYYASEQEDTFIPAMTCAVGSFLFYNGREADIRDPDSTDYSTVFLRLTVANTASRPSEAGTLNLTLPTGFSFVPDSVERGIPLNIDAMAAGEEQEIWLAVYPQFSLQYSHGQQLSCSYDGGSVPTGCAINLPTERADYAKINYNYDEALKTYRYAYYQWDADVLNRDNTRFHQELNQLSAALSSIVYFAVGHEEDAIAAMQSLGFSCIELGGKLAVMEYPHIVAQKLVVTGSGQLQQLIVTSVLGTVDGAGWLGNLSFTETQSNHASFQAVANNAFQTLDSYETVYGLSGAEQKMLITGHSRGAASANLLADKVNQHYASNWENIYAYTYATPHVATPETVQAAAQRNTNIFNISNFYDLVGYVPGCYDIHGTTMFYKKTEDNVAPLYIAPLRTLSLLRVGMSPMAKMDLARGGIWAGIQMNRILFYHLMPFYMQDVWNLDTGSCMTYAAAVTAMEQEYARLIPTVAKQGADYYSSRDMEAFLNGAQMADSATAGILGAEGYAARDYATGSDIDILCPAQLPAFIQNPANNLCMQINCPVDFVICDENDNVIGQVLHDEPTIGSGELIVSVVGDKKKLNLLSDRSYYIYITGYEEGTMDLTMLTLGATDEESSLQSYRNVRVSPDEILTARVENGVLTMVDHSAQPMQPDVTEHGLQQAVIRTEAHESALYALGSGSYYVGEQVVLTTAPAREGTAFAGWYCGEELFSTEQTLVFLCEESLTLTPKFVSPEELPEVDAILQARVQGDRVVSIVSCTEAAELWAAAYDADGRLLWCGLTEAGSGTVSVSAPEGVLDSAAQIRVFLLDAQQQPLCPVKPVK